MNDGSEIELSRNDTVIFVGPTNAGKSVLLKEIHRLLQHANVPGIIAKRIEIAQDGSFGELKAYLETTLKKVHAGNAQFIYQGPMGFAAYEIQVEQRWKSAVNNGLEEFQGTLRKFALDGSSTLCIQPGSQYFSHNSTGDSSNSSDPKGRDSRGHTQRVFQASVWF